jgi:hypothetical protein
MHNFMAWHQSLVFIDSLIDHAHHSIQGIISGAKVIFLESTHDKIVSITQALSPLTYDSSTHIVTKRQAECLLLGSTQFNPPILELNYATSWQS